LSGRVSSGASKPNFRHCQIEEFSLSNTHTKITVCQKQISLFWNTLKWDLFYLTIVKQLTAWSLFEHFE